MSSEAESSVGTAVEPSSGRVGFVRGQPLGGVGARLDPSATLDDWRKAGDLDWEGRMSPITFDTHEGGRTMPKRNVLYRSDNLFPLAIVSDKYQPHQPTEILGFFQEYVEKLGAFTIEFAGTLAGGRKIWAVAKSNEDAFDLGDGDKIQRQLLLGTSFDLTLPTFYQQTSTRIFCANQLPALFSAGVKGIVPQIRIKHREKFDADFVKERAALDSRWSGFMQNLEKLRDAQMNDEAASKYFMDVVYPVESRTETNFSEAGSRRRLARLMDVLHGAPGQDAQTAKNTAWGALNAITYFIDHESRARTAGSRLERAWFGDGARIKSRAFATALEFAGVSLN